MAEPTTISLFTNVTDIERYEAGDVIFAAGDLGKTFYVVRAGSVALESDGQTIETVHEGGVFGEMALLDNEPRSAAAIAATDCELVAIDERYFRFLIGQTPFFAQTVMRVMAGRLRRASTDRVPEALA
jgi:CRP/FNR family cyclic AMP-dependent transcriptional regulator